jgi:hypothetical protein
MAGPRLHAAAWGEKMGSALAGVTHETNIRIMHTISSPFNRKLLVASEPHNFDIHT